VLLSVTIGILGSFGAIVLSGLTLDLYGQIGMVVLIGLAAKNGILIVEFANQLRDAGQSVHDAIRNAALIRLRPVVMTMIATVLGGLPLVLRSGAGSEARHALGWVIVGGLGFATVFTLFLTPVMFEMLARFSKPRMSEERRLQRELAAAGTFTPRPEEIGDVGGAYPVPAE
jgi:HAE1 family hydrophobic/amphiphilic exporter-1